MTEFMLFNLRLIGCKNRLARSAIIGVVLTALVSACSSDSGSPTNSSPSPVANEPLTTPNIDTGVGTDAPSVDNGQFSIQLSATQVPVVEGGNGAAVTLTAVRQNGHSAPITLALRGDAASDEANLRWTFSDEQLDINETSSTLVLELGIGRAAIPQQTRNFTLVATDGASTIEADISLTVTPTPRPDVYLLIGQSNMVGSSLPDARESDLGESDATDPRIFQLNATGNDSTNFPTPAAFTNNANVTNADAPLVLALDPLHDGFDFSINSKENTQIGLGLSFARVMVTNTTTDVYLVPSAWSDTGFCRTGTNLFPGLGWNATQPADTVNFAGTLLHDRALTRLNLTLEETGGILRGILWHQGEADSNSSVCADAYENNLGDMVASIRERAQVDARGQQARGEAADIPFIVGTLSRGLEFANFSGPKQQVDGVLRTVSTFIPFAATVISDDLVPPTYPCGQGSCIHFGATALREMGNRYADRMLEVQRR